MSHLHVWDQEMHSADISIIQSASKCLFVHGRKRVWIYSICMTDSSNYICVIDSFLRNLIE